MGFGGDSTDTVCFFLHPFLLMNPRQGTLSWLRSAAGESPLRKGVWPGAFRVGFRAVGEGSQRSGFRVKG